MNSNDIMFPVHEFYLDIRINGNITGTNHKSIFRYMSNGTVRSLAVVKNSYKVIQNKELFDAVDVAVFDAVGQEKFATHRAKSYTAFDGAMCVREYAFPDISYRTPEGYKAVFRIIAINSFGKTAIKLYFGAIDMFCANGMILGSFESVYKKHTKGLTIANIVGPIANAVKSFVESEKMVKLMRSTYVTFNEVAEFLEENFSKSLATKLLHGFEQNAVNRGSTAWGLYATLTEYATHENFYPVKKGNSDHKNATMIKREEEIQKLIVKFMDKKQKEH